MGTTKPKEEGRRKGLQPHSLAEYAQGRQMIPKEAQDLGSTWSNPHGLFQSQGLREGWGFAPNNTAKPEPGSRLLRH